MKKQKLYVVVGPTASGKTDHAIELARSMNGAVVSADSRQVYTGMNIGTAKPKDAWQDDPHSPLDTDSVQGIDHYLLNISPPIRAVTLARWQSLAFTAIDTIFGLGKTPILAGGTMLYVDSVTYNFDIPEVKPDDALRAKLELEDLETLYDQLLDVDPDAANFIEPHHRQRIIRALEVITHTGRPFSALRRQREPRYDVVLTGLFPHVDKKTDPHAASGIETVQFTQEGWEELRRRLQIRSQQMFNAGLVEEVHTLREEYGDIPLLQTMGYKQAGEVLREEKSIDSAVESFCQAQMKYARRQIAWWKRDSNIRWISG